MPVVDAVMQSVDPSMNNVDPGHASCMQDACRLHASLVKSQLNSDSSRALYIRHSTSRRNVWYEF